MTCDKCKYFRILYEPLRAKDMLFDLGRAKCEEYNQITDFANHGKFKRLDTCDDFELAEEGEQE